MGGLFQLNEPALYASSFNVSLFLFALYDLLLGYLIVRSKFVPRALGIAMIVAGAGWATFIWPPLALSLSKVIMPLGFLAELLLALWLLVKGASYQRAE